jgi:hypothetical protein
VRIAHKIIPSGNATVVRDYARGNLDEAEFWSELTALGYKSNGTLRIQASAWM